MTKAYENELHTSQKYKVKGFKKQQEKVYNVYYDIEELETIHAYHFKEKRLEQTKDRFLVGCFTGLRFTDLSSLGKSNIDNGFIIQDTSKTDIQLTTTHTMRRSLASNMYLCGIRLEDIMPITGHKSAAQLLEYIKVEGLRRAQELSKSSFFQRKTDKETTSEQPPVYTSQQGLRVS